MSGWKRLTIVALCLWWVVCGSLVGISWMRFSHYNPAYDEEVAAVEIATSDNPHARQAARDYIASRQVIKLAGAAALAGPIAAWLIYCVVAWVGAGFRPPDGKDHA